MKRYFLIYYLFIIIIINLNINNFIFFNNIQNNIVKVLLLKNIQYFKVSSDTQKEYPKEAYHLLSKLLDLDYKTRFTVDQALSHPFFKL